MLFRSTVHPQLRNSGWTVRADTAFADVVAGCAAPRAGQSGGTWITADMQEAYIELHRLGHAHSIEVFDGGRLVGGRRVPRGAPGVPEQPDDNAQHDPERYVEGVLQRATHRPLGARRQSVDVVDVGSSHGAAIGG